MLINSPNISGSLTVTGNSVISGSLNVLGSITGAITGSATTASYVEFANVADKPALVSGSSQVTYSGLTGVPSGIVSGSEQVSFNGIVNKPTLVSGSAQISDFGIFATTGSNQFNGSQAITGSLTVTGAIVAQTLNVQQVTSSIVFSSGSNIFGNSLANTQQFTGSVGVTGSLTVAGAGTFTGVLNGSSAVFSSTVSATQYTATSTGGSGLRVYGAAGTNQWDIYLNSTNLRFSDNTGTGNIVFDRPLNASTINAGQSLFQVSDAGVGTKTIVSTLERTSASPSSTTREVGLAFKDGNNSTLVGGVAGVRFNSSGNYYGGLKFYVMSTSGTSATTFSDLTAALTIDYASAATFTGNLAINNTLSSPGNLIETAGLNMYLRPASGYKVFIDTGNGLDVSSGVTNLSNLRTSTIYTEYTKNLSGAYNSGTFYEIVNSSQMASGIYMLRAYVDTYAIGGGTYYVTYASVPFYFSTSGTNSADTQTFPTMLGSGHAGLNPPIIRLRLSSGTLGGLTYLEFNPNASWSNVQPGISGATVTFFVKRLGD